MSDKYRWSPPEHADPSPNPPISAEPDPTAVPVAGYPPVWVTIDFEQTGTQRVPGFVEQASPTSVYAQIVHMGYNHHVWVPRSAVTARQLRKPA